MLIPARWILLPAQLRSLVATENSAVVARRNVICREWHRFFLAQAGTLSLHLTKRLDNAQVPLTQPCASLRPTPRQGTHIY